MDDRKTVNRNYLKNYSMAKLTSTSTGRTPFLCSLFTPNTCMLNAPILSRESVISSLDCLGATATAPTNPRRDTVTSRTSAQRIASNRFSCRPFMFDGCDVR